MKHSSAKYLCNNFVDHGNDYISGIVIPEGLASGSAVVLCTWLRFFPIGGPRVRESV